MSSYLLAGDCREKLSYIDSETVDLTIMSPPYKDRDGYSDSLMFEVSQQLYRVHRPGTLAFINFGHMADYKSRPFDVVRMFEGTGWELKETFIWVKNHFKPIQGHRRVNNIFEYIFMFNKTPMPLLDRLALGVPYADKSNIGRYSDQDLRCGGNVWYIPYETITKSEDKLHHDRFPPGLPRNCISLCNYPMNTVLDPFVGSGTTPMVAMEFGLDYIGIDLSEENIRIAEDRISQRRNELDAGASN